MTDFTVREVERRSTSTVDAVVERLKEEILGGQLPPGTFLPAEAQLSSMLGVSRATLREGLQILETTGVVRRDDTPRRRLVVTDENDRLSRLALDDLIEYGSVTFEEVFEVLDVVNPQIARLAAERASPDERQEIRDTIERLGRSEDLDEAEKLHLHFHEIAVKASGNRLWIAMWHSIEPALEPMKVRALRGTMSVDRLYTLHTPLAEAVVSGDSERAFELAGSHNQVFKSAHEALEEGSNRSDSAAGSTLGVDND